MVKGLIRKKEDVDSSGEEPQDQEEAVQDFETGSQVMVSQTETENETEGDEDVEKFENPE